ncbi:MAG: DegT/DnrJ/EryC1/StrS family aminotransferase [Saprospiraceae bacterium]|nr:DegT/DnrJ/EryC1/StrS family aminotransferase [Saprospiraceae bacterium]
MEIKEAKRHLQMVDVKTQYLKIKEEVDRGIQEVIDSCAFINGPAVKKFAKSLGTYLDAEYVIPCANGTDALQIALMAMGLKPGDEVIVPAFTYVATAEVIALLQLKPVMVDVDPESFNLSPEIVEEAITPLTKCIVPVNLYGQNSDLEGIMKLAEKHKIFVLEDNAQAIGSDYIFSDGTRKKSGTIGHIGSTSFYPSKNLGAYGDGGALYTNNRELGERMKMIANHGQSKKYVHNIIGCNSRLDSIQAAILDVKLKHLDAYCSARQEVADRYDLALINVEGLEIPKRMSYSTHVFHQYTLKVTNGKRDELKSYLASKGIPSMIYYPIPLYDQEAFKPFTEVTSLPITEKLCKQVLSLPIHTEMDLEDINYVIQHIKSFFKN